MRKINGIRELVNNIDPHVQVSECGNTIWIHAEDGTTVGRFSKVFGMDVHTCISNQLDGASQCLHCTHAKPSREDWLKFCELILLHYSVKLDPDLMKIPSVKI